MKLKIAALAGLAVLGAEPAAAQSRWSYESPYVYEGLPARVIVRIVRSRGLTPVARPMLRDGIYVVRAVDAYGEPRRVLIDADSGRIVRIHAAGRRELDRDFAMRPPVGIPSRRRLPSDEVEEYPERPALPPPAPRASLPDDPETLPPPPPPGVRPGQADQPPSSRGERRATRPPVPRPRPVDTAEATGTAPAAPSANPVSAAPVRPKPLPRVVLPGGPLPKAERTAETRPGQRVIDAPTQAEKPATSPAPAAAAPAVPNNGMPPVAPLE